MQDVFAIIVFLQLFILIICHCTIAFAIDNMSFAVFLVIYLNKSDIWSIHWKRMRWVYYFFGVHLKYTVSITIYIYFFLFTLQDIDFDVDWKLLTILIGMNDICDYCKDKALLTKLFLWQATDRRFFYSIYRFCTQCQIGKI